MTPHECPHDEHNNGAIDCGVDAKDSEGTCFTYMCNLCMADTEIAQLKRRLEKDQKALEQVYDMLYAFEARYDTYAVEFPEDTPK